MNRTIDWVFIEKLAPNHCVQNFQFLSTIMSVFFIPKVWTLWEDHKISGFCGLFKKLKLGDMKLSCVRKRIFGETLAKSATVAK